MIVNSWLVEKPQPINERPPTVLVEVVSRSDFDAVWSAFTHIADSEFGMTGEELYEMLRHSQYIGGDKVLDLPDLGFVQGT